MAGGEGPTVRTMKVEHKPGAYIADDIPHLLLLVTASMHNLLNELGSHGVFVSIHILAHFFLGIPTDTVNVDKNTVNPTLVKQVQSLEPGV